MKLPVNWKTTALSVAAATLGSFATVANLDQLTPSQAAVAFGLCLLTAIKGVLTADAKAVKEVAAEVRQLEQSTGAHATIPAPAAPSSGAPSTCPACGQPVTK